jgi:hypothetical protein
VTSGQGAKFRPGLPMEENSPRNSSTDCSSGPDGVERVERPEANDKKRCDAEGAAGELEPVAATAATAIAAAATAAHQDLELFLPFADNLVDLRDLLIATGPPRSAGSAARAIVAPVAAA